jgi:soluble lytic murein transglycosylase-like protein
MTARRSFSQRGCLTGMTWVLAIIFVSVTAFPGGQLEDKYDNLIRSIAQKYRVEDDLIHSIIRAESNYNQWAVSSKGALGLMQLMPDTAVQYGVKNVFDPRDNIEGGVKYLKDLIRLFSGRTDLVLAAYNAGQQAVKKYNGIPPYQETRNYIKKIMLDFGYNKEYIKRKTIIYRFYDERGKIVLTNDRELYLRYKDNKPKN